MYDLGRGRVVWLLRQRGFPYWDEARLEEKISVAGKRPDFHVEPPGFTPFLVEVEGFQEEGPYHADRAERSRVMAVSPKVMEKNLSRIKKAVDRAAEQHKVSEHLKVPMVVALDNALCVGISLSAVDLIQLLGLMEFRGDIDSATGERLGPTYLHHGAGQVLSPLWKRYLSAVAVNLPKDGYQHVEPVNQERPMRLRIFHNPYALIPLPGGVFTDPEDEHIRPQWVSATYSA